MPPPAAPFELELIARKLIKPRTTVVRQGSGVSATRAAATPGADGGSTGGDRTELSSFDAISAFLATSRAYGFGAGSSLDARVLEAALEATVTDLPFLAGRMGRMKGRRLGTLAIEHTGDGALLTVVEADEVSLACMAPDTWPQGCMALTDQEELAFYIDPMDTGRAMLVGREPVMKVRLTQLKDGQILGITLSHAIVDGMRWPALEAHLAARYRQYADGPRPDASQLLRPTDRRLLAAEHMAEQLLGKDSSWKAPASPVSSSLVGYWRLARQALAASRRNSEFLMIYLPRGAAAELKALAAEGNPGAGITTGDAVQAAVSLLLHAAKGLPLLPVAPKAMSVMVQVPVPEGYFGNAVRMIEVSLPQGTEQPVGQGAAAALCQLAGAIRRVSAEFRSQLERALEAMSSTEALVGAPVLRMLSYMCGELQPNLTSATNYNPTPQTIDLGCGTPVYTRQVSVPRARDIAIIRPAVAPYPEGLFVQVCMHPTAASRLRQLPMLAVLLPAARFVGIGISSGSS